MYNCTVGNPLIAHMMQNWKYDLFYENTASSLNNVSICFGVSQVLQVLAVLPLSSLLPWRDGMTSLSCLEVLEHLLTLLETSTHRWAIQMKLYHVFVFFPWTVELYQKMNFVTSKSFWFLHVLFIMLIFTNEHNLWILKHKYNRQK